jgi:hypothetical protein
LVVANGWHCEECGTFHAESVLHTKITVDLFPRDYAAVATFCSFECLDQYRSGEYSDMHDRPYPTDVRYEDAVITRPTHPSLGDYEEAKEIVRVHLWAGSVIPEGTAAGDLLDAEFERALRTLEAYERNIRKEEF